MAKESPATSCMALKTLKSGTYWLKNAKGAVFQTYCDNDNTEGGWSYAASFTSNGPRSEWNFYSDQWVRGVTSTLVFEVESYLFLFSFFLADGRVIRICIRRHLSSSKVNGGSTLRASLVSPYTNNKNNVKTQAFNGIKFNEMLVTSSDGEKFIVVEKLNKGNNKVFDNLAQIFQGCYKERGRDEMCHLFGNRKASNGGGMWNYPHWAFNNIEWGSDQCWNARIAVCKQTATYHTGGGSLIGTGCSGKNGGNKFNLMKTSSGGSTYSCTGSQPQNLPIDSGVSTFHIFVRNFA